MGLGGNERGMSAAATVLKDDDALEMKSARKRNGGIILPNNDTAPTAEVSEVSEKRQQRHAEVKYPDYLMSSFLSFLVFVMAATMRADWVVFLAHYWRSQELANAATETDSATSNATDVNDVTAAAAAADMTWNAEISAFLAQRFAGFTEIAIPAFAIAYLFFFGIGGFFHYYYYHRQRDTPEKWKCQPNHWLPFELEIHEMAIGLFSLTIGNVISALVACWILNGGYTTMYYGMGDKGYLWWFLQWPVIFIYQDYVTYWMHRVYHLPFLYRHFHKLHHTYKQPTAFSVTAIHPVEFVNIQMIYISPTLIMPIHFVPFCAILMYTYYHGILDHSGITFKRKWWQPWQPDAIFHDNHHQYFHVNFGFNIEFWDKLHGTYRRKDRIYTEDIYYGQGKKLSEATDAEKEADLKERRDENPLAYQGNKHQFEMSEEEMKKVD